MNAGRIEIVNSLGSENPIPVENSSDAAWAQDREGRIWVVKHEANTGYQALLAEACCHLLGRLLGVQQPQAAVLVHGADRAWLSLRVPNVSHWFAGAAPRVVNSDALGAMLVLDVVSHNEDRHRGNILLQPAPDEFHLRTIAIDSGNALVSQPEFHDLALGVPSTRNLAPGLPLAQLTPGALRAAQIAASLSEMEISDVVQEACSLARETDSTQMHSTLLARLRAAPRLISGYLEQLKRDSR
ncbi:MAG: hypothetical protein JST92_02885 [Deltaproteobacteria bacterium]|nr:hypothetical protein [Deltaproteobacteria bacterium]